jgi:hypothetical protein
MLLLVLRPDRVQERRYRRDQLGRSEWLGQQNAVGHAARSPLVGMGSGDVDDGKFRVDLSGLPGDLPAIHFAPEIDVRHQRAIRAGPAPEQRDRFLARRRDRRLKTAVRQCVFDNDLNRHVVFDYKHYKLIISQRITLGYTTRNVGTCSSRHALSGWHALGKSLNFVSNEAGGAQAKRLPGGLDPMAGTYVQFRISPSC